MAKTLHFRNDAAYRKWLAYDKIHVNPKKSKSPKKIEIAGRPHKVRH
jgi:hypothetical protein